MNWAPGVSRQERVRARVVCRARAGSVEERAGEGGHVLMLGGSVGGGEEAHHSRSHKWPRKPYIPPLAVLGGLYCECDLGDWQPSGGCGYEGGEVRYGGGHFNHNS